MRWIECFNNYIKIGLLCWIMKCVCEYVSVGVLLWVNEILKDCNLYFV